MDRIAGLVGTTGETVTVTSSIKSRGNPLFVEEAKGEEYIHKIVWRVAKRQLAYAEAYPEGASMDHLVAMVFTSHALEGYSNYLLQKVAPNLWRDERKHFALTRLEGKLDALHDICGLSRLERGKRPWSTFEKLKKLRNSITHPRIKFIKICTVYREGKEPPLFAKR